MNTKITLETLQNLKDRIDRLAELHGVRNIRIFGSVARGDSGPKSDVDLWIEMEEGRDALDVGGFLMEMQDLLGCKVDVITRLSPYIEDQVRKEAIPL